MYGKGVYFARDAAYSIRSFCPVDKDGYRYIYLARVLTGWYVEGTKDMMLPPNLPGHKCAKYDSTVDQIPFPQIFVAFHDAQAYPEYLIKFKCGDVNKIV